FDGITGNFVPSGNDRSVQGSSSKQAMCWRGRKAAIERFESIQDAAHVSNRIPADIRQAAVRGKPACYDFEPCVPFVSYAQFQVCGFNQNRCSAEILLARRLGPVVVAFLFTDKAKNAIS